MAKRKKYNFKIVLLYIISFIVSIAPLLAVLIARWGVYTETPGDTVRLLAGGVILCVFVVLKVVGALKLPRRIVTFAVVFLLAFLLESVLDDLLLLSGMALLGEFLDLIFFQTAIKNTKEEERREMTADTTAEKVEEVLKKYVGDGRV